MIEARDIEKSFENEQVLHNLSLKVETGKVYTLIGPSGCGKSTLLRILLGLLEPDAGSVWLGGTKLDASNQMKLRQSTGYVIQNGGLFPHLTASSNCTLAPEYLGWSAEKMQSRLSELSELTGIEKEWLQKYPGELSGGQQQRISLIRALMTDPGLLFLDEPLGSIDPLVRYELQQDLKRIFRSLNKTVLMVTHDLGEAAFLGDHLVLMKEGVIVQQGEPKELLRNPENEFVEQFINAQRGPLEDFT